MRRVSFFNLRLVSAAALAVLVLTLPACSLLSLAAETPPAPTLEPSAQVTPFEAEAGGADTPAPSPTEAAPDAGGMSAVDYEGITFTYPSSLATEVRTETVPREEVTGDAPFWASAPEHVTFTFEGYPVGDSIHTPTIYVYPAAEFAQVNEFAGGVIGGLNDLLASRPETPPDPIPFFPIFNAAQVFHTHFTYLDFASGSGVRYLTHFSQAPIVVANDNLIYTYQGLSADGAWVVSAALPVASPILPATGSQPPEGDWDAFAANYPAYLSSLVAELEAQPPSSFTPDLDTLDAMVASITIQR